MKKMLGIIIDDKLSWKPHIQSVKSKLAKTMSIIYKVTFFLKASALITLYFSLFLKGLGIDYFILLTFLAPCSLLLRDIGKYLSHKSNAPIHSTKKSCENHVWSKGS